MWNVPDMCMCMPILPVIGLDTIAYYYFRAVYKTLMLWNYAETKKLLNKSKQSCILSSTSIPDKKGYTLLASCQPAS